MKSQLLKALASIILPVFLLLFAGNVTLNAQIYEPEGLNMPGNWDGWSNPPSNPVLANPNQLTGGQLVRISTGQIRWQTIFSSNASGGNLLPGNYNWLFTSGPNTNYFANKWAGVNVVMNTLQNYTFNTGADNNITLADGKWYTMNWEDLGYQNSRAIFMETSAQPIEITSVSVPANPLENLPSIVSVTTNNAPSAEEIVYLRYTIDGWASSAALVVSMNGTNGQVSIPGQTSGTVVDYYVFTSTVASLSGDYDLCTIKLNNNSGTNYSFTVGTPPDPEITWANLQWPANGAITTGNEFLVYGQAFIEGITGQATAAPGLQAWVGYNSADTDPATWTNWVAATFNGPSGNNDEFTGDIGSAIATAGTYYYATRFQYNDDPFVYGGFNGGFWDGTANVSGVLTVTDPIPDPDFNWVNLQFPGSATIEPGENLDVFAQAYIEGVTGQPTPAPGVTTWIGYSNTNSNPATWINWFPATFNAPSGNNDEYVANLGQYITSEGTYYYASRFQLNSGEYFYGGYSETGGGFWDGSTNISGILTVQAIQPDTEIDWANLQFPGSGEITLGDNFDVYAQAYIEGVTGQSSQATGLEAWIGISTSNTNPATWSQWTVASYNAASGNNDEFMLNLSSQLTTAGTYYYASRFRYNGGAYYYGGYSGTGGGFWDGTYNVSGVVTVSEPQQPYPVLFTIIDGTELHDNIKFKGEMTAWDTVAMIRDGFTWTLTLDLFPGTYEWGAIEADGSEFGIWLIEGDNLLVTLGEDGSITGTVSYTTYVTNVNTLPLGSKIYPNPVQQLLTVEVPGLSAYQLLDISSRIILDKPSTRENETIDLSSLENGLYLLKIKVGDRFIVKKVVKE